MGTLQERTNELEADLAKTQATLHARDSALSQAGQRLHLSEKRCDKLVATRDRIRKELKKLQRRDFRAAKKRKQDQGKRPVFHLKSHGHVRNNVRDIILDLTTMNVPSGKVYQVFLALSELFQIDLVGSFSEGTVLRVIEEGGVAAMAQLRHAMTGADCASIIDLQSSAQCSQVSTAATLSSDGTSHKKINYVAKHVVLCAEDAKPRSYVLPVTVIDDHTSETQRNDWLASIRKIFCVYEAIFAQGFTVNTWREFIQKIKGASTDHAADQKLLIQLLVAWKCKVDQELCGEAALRAKSAVEVLQLVHAELCASRGKEALSPAAWEALPEEEQARMVSEAWRAVCIPLGEAAFEELSAEEQAEIDSFVWAGCCMHKGMNTAKAAFEQVGLEWPLLGIAPIKMVTKDNCACMEKAADTERERILALSKGGASKLTELLGALLKNKDNKKGQQDLYKIAFEVCSVA
jgi:hypothetical protein